MTSIHQLDLAGILTQDMYRGRVFVAFLICTGVLLLIAGVSIIRRRRLARNATGIAPVRPRRRDRSAAKRRLASDIDELTRLCLKQLDARAASIEALLDRADVAIARLEVLEHDLEAGAMESRVNVRRVRHNAGARRVEGSSEIEPLARQIYQLADSGKSPVEIASALEEHVGKVELILALRN